MSLEGNKIVGAVLLAGVLAMGSGYTAKILVGGGGHHGAHHDGHGSGLGKVIEIPEIAHSDKGAVKKAEEILEPVLPLLASADLGKGQKISKKCTQCHTFAEGGAQKTGPNLYNIVNRAIAADEAYTYAGLKEKADGVWSYANLNAFLAKPKKWAPGTKMNFAGLKKVGDRAAMIAYLRSLSATPAPIE